MDIEAQAVGSASPRANRHIHQYLESSGEAVDHPIAERLILLYTSGRRTGKIRRVPLTHIRDGDAVLIVASNGGADDHPSWYVNIAADPRVWVRHKADFFEATATTLGSVERAEVWPRLVEPTHRFAEYQERAARQIPIVRIRRQG